MTPTGAQHASSPASPPGRIVRFGVFELNLESHELRKAGMRVRLSQQPLLLLSTLVERPGHVFAREELRQRLWPSGVFVDFEHGLNKSVQKLRQALGDSAESPLYIETVHRIGYRFIAPLLPSQNTDQSTSATRSSAFLAADSASSTEQAPASQILPAPSTSPAPVASGSQRRRWTWAVIFAAPAVIGILVLIAGSSRRAPIHSLALLPFANLSGDAGQDYFAKGMTDELATDMAALPGLRVVTGDPKTGGRGDQTAIRQIARELNVDSVVEGSVVRSGDRVRVTARLIDARTEATVWAKTFESQISDVLTLQDSIAREITSNTRLALTSSRGGPGASPVRVNPVAYDAYLRGRYFFSKREISKSVSYFQQSVSLDPSYAQGYAGLADALESENTLGIAPPDEVSVKAIAASRQAIALDPGNGDAYTSLGSLETTYEWRWQQAEQDLRRGIELAPGSSLAEMKYAAFLDAVNRPEDAVDHMRTALALDPLSFFMNRHMGSTLFFARRYDEALDWLKRAREMEPDKAYLVDNWMSWIFEKKGLQQEAVEFDLASSQRKLPDNSREKLLQVYRRAGWQAYWQERLAGIHADASPCSAYDAGVIELRLGKQDAALDHLNTAIRKRCFWMMWVKVDPLLDGIRNNPGYPELLHRLSMNS